ncbi:MAG: WbqC family protein [Pyrinomonadaceae bacterium]
MAVVQSNYIPWRGYFDLMNVVDEFILFDNMQYTRRDWRNRNLIKCRTGIEWLTIPVKVKGKYFQEIKDTVISDVEWNHHHWKTIVHCYSKARHFSDYRETFEELYLNTKEIQLSLINHRFLAAICRLLGIKTKLTWSMDYQLIGDKTERLVSLCKQAGATNYLSGPKARAYLNEDLFAREAITVSYMDYSGYPEYNQLYPPFQPAVSIIDLIFNEGDRAHRFMKSF